MEENKGKKAAGAEAAEAEPGTQDTGHHGASGSKPSGSSASEGGTPAGGQEGQDMEITMDSLVDQAFGQFYARYKNELKSASKREAMQQSFTAGVSFAFQLMERARPQPEGAHGHEGEGEHGAEGEGAEAGHGAQDTEHGESAGEPGGHGKD